MDPIYAEKGLPKVPGQDAVHCCTANVLGLSLSFDVVLLGDRD